MIIPSINVETFADLTDQIKKVEPFVEWVHLDIEDGKFIERVTWNNPDELSRLTTSANMEVHLMIENPEAYIERWANAGTKRVIVHIEAIDAVGPVIDACKKHGVEAGLALNPNTAVDHILSYAKAFDMILFMGVFPGASGQEFIAETTSRIRLLKSQVSSVKIELDGGVNEATARAAKDAGVDYFVSGSYIFSRPDPKEAIEELKRATS